jgi:hypothetical protein
MARSPWWLVGVVLLAASGCARPDWIESTLVTVDVGGTWNGTYGRPAKGTADLTLVQRGAKVAGRIKLAGLTEQPVEGVVNGDVLRFQQVGGGLSGELVVDVDEMTGVVSVKGRLTGPATGVLEPRAELQLRRQRPE